jgi:hypothetical protein
VLVGLALLLIFKKVSIKIKILKFSENQKIKLYFYYFQMPETKGLSIDEIIKSFNKK